MAFSRVSGAAVLAVAAAGVLAACSSSGGSGATGTSSGGTSSGSTGIKVAVSWSLNGLPAQLAHDEGIFTNHRLKVTFVKVSSDSQVVPMVMSGQVQFGQLGTGSTIQSLSKGKNLPIEITSPNTESDKPVNGKAFGDIVVSSKSTIASPKQLEGKNVAVSGLKTDAWVAARAAIDDAGGDSSKVNFVQIPGPQMVSALQQGQVDAAVLGEPGVTPALDKGSIKVLSPVDSGPEGTAASMYVSTKSWAQKNANVAQEFRAAIEEAANIANKNRASAVKVASTNDNIPASVLQTASFPLYSTGLTAESLQWPIEHAIKYGLVDQTDAPDAAALVAGLA